MNISNFIGSWAIIVAVPVIAYGAQYIGVPVDTITFQLSVLALTFTQLVLRQQTEENEEDRRVQEEQLHVEKKIEKEVTNNGE